MVYTVCHSISTFRYIKRQSNLVKFYVNYGAKSKYYGNYGIILHKKKKKKKKKKIIIKKM